MPKYAKMLADGLQKKGHTVEILTASAFFHRLPSPPVIKKWMGYIDQYVLFPLILSRKTKKMDSDTLYVFADQALGPWIPYVSKQPHVVHCHDFLAQRSALGEMAENKVGVTGKIYQSLIRRGYRKASNFISISKKTQSDLHRFLDKRPNFSKVVYNGLNQDFQQGNQSRARVELTRSLGLDLGEGYILHVGGNQFYKNRKGVITIYSKWREMGKGHLPLLMVGAVPSKELLYIKENSPFSNDIYFLTSISDEMLRIIYNGASVLLFPSLEEGFGWPIAEGLASGCPVITIDKPPMNEVGGEVCFYLPEPPPVDQMENWLEKAAVTLNEVVNMPECKRKAFRQQAGQYAQRFNSLASLDSIERIYLDILKSYQLK